MPLTPCTAADMLAAPEAEKPIWARFDADWYRHRYQPDLAGVDAADDAAVRGWYVRNGQAARHSPNCYFDERWFLWRHRPIIDQIARGTVASGFDAYCRGRFVDRSPHWLFDELFYRRRYSIPADEYGPGRAAWNAYDDYLRTGDRAGRSGHPIFEPARYLESLGDVAEAARAQGPFVHYLDHLPDKPEPRVGFLFDPEWYMARYPQVAAAVADGVWPNGLAHYLANATPTAFDPSPWFSESFYLVRYPDIAEVVAAGNFRCGYLHFLIHGARELRQPCMALDLRGYADSDPAMKAEIAAGHVTDAFVHFLRAGTVPPVPQSAPVAAVPNPAPLSVHGRATLLLPTLAQRTLDFTCNVPPALSVVVTMRDGFADTLLSLARLRTEAPAATELILVDRGSADATRMIARQVKGALLLRFESEIGVVRARNAGLLAASAPLVLFLDPTVELAPGAIAAACARLAAEPATGAVGGKIIGPDGRHASAGYMLWRDGSIEAYLHGAAPGQPEAAFRRDIDACDPAFLMVRRELLNALDGFDETFDAPLTEIADLALRMAEVDARLAYDPAVAVFAPGAGDKAAAQSTFFRKHLNALRQRYIADPRVALFARETGADAGKRVLFIEDTVPLRHLGSGFVRSNDIVARMVALGYRVSVFPVNANRVDPVLIPADFPDTVEVLHDRALRDLAAFLGQRAGYYDAIWVARTHNLDHTLAALKGAVTGSGRPPRMILDTEAIAALRDVERARLEGGTPVDPAAAILREFANAHYCQGIVATTDAEAQTLRDLGFNDVAVLGHVRQPTPGTRDFARRSGLFFVGAIHEQNSPNYDSLCWFVDEVLPKIETELGWETRLTILGFTGTGVSLDRFRQHPRITLRGTVADTAPLYDVHRIFVAPTRFAAGTPYKVHEAASFGVPVVATTLLARQTGWRDGQELLAAGADDPAGFAAKVVQLYRDEALWQRLRAAALARIAAEHGPEHYDRVLKGLIG